MFVWWNLSFMCLLNDNLPSRVSPRCFWFELSLISELLKKIGGCVIAFFSLEKIISCACLVRSGLNDIFHWYAQSCFFNRSLLSVEAEVYTVYNAKSGLRILSSAHTLYLVTIKKHLVNKHLEIPWKYHVWSWLCYVS